MKQLELQQEREERELLERAGKSDATPASESAANGTEAKTNGTGPVRSQSGNDLASFNTNDNDGDEGDNTAAKAKSKYANAKSMPGSRRHSGEIKDGAAVTTDGTQQKKDGQPMLNSFLFDDDLDDDLKSTFTEYFKPILSS